MIITRAPFRLSLFGGSSDYSSFYSRYGSLLVGFTIDKYVYLSFKKNENFFDYKTRATYSVIESVKCNKEIQNPGIRGALEYFKMDGPLCISVQSDLPKQTGIGSSSSLSVALTKAIDIYKNGAETYTKKQLAQHAINIERVHLNEPGGIQDQIWAAYGGINSIEIEKTGNFKVRPLHISEEFLSELRDRLILCHTGSGRNSFNLAAAHDSDNSIAIKEQIKRIAELGLRAFEIENVDEIGRLLHKSWMLKKSIATDISNANIDAVYDRALDNGAIGGKLLGAGANGFMLFLLKEQTDRVAFCNKVGLSSIDFDYSYRGAEALLK